MPAHASPLVTVHFGNTTSQGCSSHWTGDCEAGFTAFGDTGSISMAHDGSGNHGALVDGASGLFPNGIRSAYSQSLPSAIELVAEGVVMADDTDVGVRIVFKDGVGDVVATSATTKTFPEGPFKLHTATTVPPSAASVDFEVGLKGTSSSAWVDVLELTNDPPTSSLTCSEAAGECSNQTCVAICGQDWCDSCIGYEKTWGCTGITDPEGDCILRPWCQCDFPNSITLTPY
jgi:hypothetical protein